MDDNKDKIIKKINVEKLNVVDKDGNIKMTLFGEGNIPPAIMDGEDILPGHRQDEPLSGVLFYNGEGDECGGLIFGSKRNESGEYHSGLSLTFDQYKQDQIIQVYVDDNNGDQNYGIQIYDRPNIPLPEVVERFKNIQNITDESEKKEALEKLAKGQHQRIFMGKNLNGDIAVRLSDSNGKERIRMVIDKEDIPRMEFLDEQGNVIYSLPPKL
ncbi:hypothetical protein [Cohnella yongneupensis]|uniref:Uncharacterized protein n=1 Tax=Cohnella yongneupensis TaxID=425006 RepID=A0ABW0QXX5_9BACL